ncbi:uncharacterized protein LOC134320860 [Trichomycterus rosablanca]|uniref:uncharacterized protein LOC134320860 n=1 Tax=Trichomycterus rosablanca TaxID=2290929 RepID=UPI002F35C5CE
MRKVGRVDLCVLVIFCYCSFIQGEHTSSLPTPTSDPKVPANSSPHYNLSTVETTSHLNISLNATTFSTNVTLTKTQNDTTESTNASASSTAVTKTTADSLTPLNTSDISGNLTYSQNSSVLSTQDNQTLSTQISSTTITLVTTTDHKANSTMSTPAFSTTNQTFPASPRSQSTTSIPEPSSTSTPTTVATQTSLKTSASTKGTTALKTTTTSTTTITQSTEHIKPGSSTLIPAKTHADSPSELNIGDDDSSVPVDPLLAGLVSAFVVTAAIVSLLIFLKFRRRNEEPEFRRLQDLPMDDMMEDTPLSMYNY